VIVVVLREYRKKRKFDVTPEPRGRSVARNGHRFIVQKHAARRLHYDLRLELDGIMKSWAVTRGPSLVPGEKRLAVHVEDHPIEYNKFEGTIPKGEYGGGTVLIWDRGRWIPEGDPHKGLAKGHLDFELEGEKLRGRWHLVRMHEKPGEKKENWLLIKSKDDAARSPRAPDILEEEPLSVVSGRSISEIAEGDKAVAREAEPMAEKSKRVKGARAGISRTKASRAASAKAPSAGVKRSKVGTSGKKMVEIAQVPLSHPDRVYWVDVGVTKQQLAEYYVSIWDWMASHIVNRPLALVRCPEGTKGHCFFQKHVAAGIADTKLRKSVEAKEKDVIVVDHVEDLVSLVQSGVLEVHVRGSTLNRLDVCDRLVFDLDPGAGVDWKVIAAAAGDVRDRLSAYRLESFVKLSGGKGLHVVVPISGTDWDTAKNFAQQVAAAMAADAPDRYVAKMTKSLRDGRIFIDYLRNTREATSVAPYSTRARSGAPVSTPVAWNELGRTHSSDQYTVLNLARRLKSLSADPWDGMARIKQKLPGG
jgi:bifunctional non-homologous end joining protein LigD